MIKVQLVLMSCKAAQHRRITFTDLIVICKWEDGCNMIDVLKKLDELKAKYKLSNYQIAKKCGLGESTIKNIYNRNSFPHIDTLDMISKGFGLTLSQFLLEDDETLVPLTEEQKDLFEKWEFLTIEQRKLVNDFIDMLDKVNKS